MAANSQAPANGHFFPKFIDRPMLIGIFDMDEFFVAFCVMVLILVGSFLFPDVGSLTVMLVSIASGLGLAVLYSKFKRNRPDGFTMQMLYRKGIFTPGVDDKQSYIHYPYLRKMGRVVPYGFTQTLFS